MKQLLKKATAYLLCFLMLISGAFTATAYTTEDIVDAALELIYRNEGVYTSVLANDVGAVSLGKIGWHATRALNLLKTIVSADQKTAEQLLGKDLTNEILTASSWESRTFTAAEKAAVEKLLATGASKKAQDSLAEQDITNYILHGQAMGITDGKALVYFADLENQMGSNGAARVASAAISAAGSAGKVTLNHIYQAAMADRTASSSPTRRNTAYSYCNALSFSGAAPSLSYQPGRYTVTASALNVRSGPGTNYATITSSLPNGTTVTVTQVSGDWGKITVKGLTGWINLRYTIYAGSSGSSSSIKGDLNGNGTIDASDARLILRYAAKLETLSDAQKAKADINADGKIDIQDARKALRVAAGLDRI